MRDRVVHIALRDDEGGLNLDMPAATIADLDRRGRAAGAKIAARFAPGTTEDPETGEPAASSFPRHRWVRYRAFMAAVEDLSRRFSTSWPEAREAAAARREPTLDQMSRGEGSRTLGYPPYEDACGYYEAATEAFDRFARELAGETAKDPHRSFDVPRGVDMPSSRRGGAPRPKMSLKLRPLVDNDPRVENGDLPADLTAADRVHDGKRVG